VSIKADRWIRRMAAEHGMIEPFSPQQVRVADGHKIISYGTSSYGYDVRCADEFKIFTNINSTIVDPKSFDEKSFVDFKGPVCIIPPNSFALASTVEYFRIPRSVLTVCLGKCVTGDTRVVDADTGAYLPITEMRWGKRTLAWDGWRLKPAKVSDFIPQGKREIFELRTRAGLRIRATANHPFRMLKRWVSLSDLRVGDRIAVAREIPVFGKTPIPEWEATLLGLMISDTGARLHGPPGAAADPAMVSLLGCTIAASGFGDITRAQDWLRNLGLDVDETGKFVPQTIFTAPEVSVRLFLQALLGSDGDLCHTEKGLCLEYHSNSRRLIEDVHHLLLRFGVFSVIHDEATAIGAQGGKIQITDAGQILRFAERIGFPPGSVKQRQLEEAAATWTIANTAARVGCLDSIAREPRSRPDQARPMPDASRVGVTTGYVNPLDDGSLWDEVERIEAAGIEEVFDITVPTLHNFVANDFIVHNSTYARCFSGDTRVALVDGTAPTLEEMAARHASGEPFWGYSIGPNGRLIVAYLDAPRCIGRDSLLEIELDNGERIRATPDHLFMRRDGRMAAASELRPHDALMPLYRDLARGYERVYQPIDGLFYPTHRLADEWSLRRAIHADAPATYGEAHASAIRQGFLSSSEEPRQHGHFAGVQTQRAKNFWHADRYDYRNHKVVAIREIPGDHDVYCLTVPEAGNFALESGVFVKNCGIIVNVTPLEPEWEGHVTLEFSNTTPLPAKIYANEGVAQMLFFESDEICETSYRDRGGKYQGQRGVTLPKA
jgi:deoxycytidine triphosphate deaminase/intein/homing endonuclease